jgi:UDP-glucose 4-epimerase
MKILVTGTNGFIGKQIVDYLKKRGDEVTEFHGDLCDLNNVKYQFNKSKYIDCVIHCATKGGRRFEDKVSFFYDNIKMVENILIFKDKEYEKLIYFGSGAEYNRTNDINLYTEYANQFLRTIPEDYYGFSKYVITQRLNNIVDAYTLRIFGCFGATETHDRFIYTNINNYINKEPMQVFQDKYFDFISVNDLIKIVEYYITKQNLHKTINCCYNKKETLKSICDNYINNLDNYKVDIVVKEKDMGLSYCGSSRKIDSLNIQFDGLELSIRNYYEVLLNK